jgi:hypothetical protein
MLMPLCLFSASLDQYPKEIRKSFSVNKDVLFRCDVDFSNVVVTTWDQSTVEVVVVVNINAKSEERANEMFEKIKVDLDGGGSQVSMKVNVDNLNCKNNENWSMDATVKMPATGSIDGHVDFGDLTISDLAGNLNINLQYGNLVAGKLSGSNNAVELAFGDAKVGRWSGGGMKAQYGNVVIAELNGNINLNLAFGDAKIEQLQSACKSLAAELEYGDLVIDLGASVGVAFDIESSYGDVNIPNSAVVTLKEKDYTSSHKVGTIGSGATKLKLISSFGDVAIVL